MHDIVHATRVSVAATFQVFRSIPAHGERVCELLPPRVGGD